VDALDELLADVPVPGFAPIRQHFATASVGDVAGAVRAQVTGNGLLSRVPEGASVAVGVGSRGVAELPVIVRTVVDLVREAGAEPFIIPAMGSHGGATAAGQVAVLEHLGVTEHAVGAPVRATMDVVQRGSSEKGLPLYVDRHAAGADGIIAINRVKPHTSFTGPVESGLLKMLVIGFGKQKGADAAHARGYEPMADYILDLSAAWLQRLPLLFGLAILENAFEQVARVVALPPERVENEERQLLGEARRLMPRILFGPLDLLVVDEIGKEISGLGMDPNITGRFPGGLVPTDVHIERIVVLRLSQATDGNSAGIGLADVTTAALESQIDRGKGYVNSLTSTNLVSVKMPMVMPSDQMAIKVGVKTSHAPDLGRLRAVRARNTRQLENIWVSEALLGEARRRPDVEVLGQAEPLAFDRQGNLRI
jgi:hypothetical protein